MPTADRKLRIWFVRVGQGDCILLRFPTGKTAMIDCGSNSWEKSSNPFEDKGDWEDARWKKAGKQVNRSRSYVRALSTDNGNKQMVRDIIRSADFLGTHTTLDALVLTHADKDHYGFVGGALAGDDKNGREDIKIGKLFVSGDADWDTALSKYSKNSAHNYLRTYCGLSGSDDISSPQVNEEVFNAGGLEEIPVLEDLSVNGGPSCSFSIIAANVAHDFASGEKSPGTSEEDQRNLTSIVTKVDFGNARFLFTGDATLSVLHFINRRMASAVAIENGVRILQIPHHGSDLIGTNGRPADLNTARRTFKQWRDLTKPHTVVASAARNHSTHHLPRVVSVQGYRDSVDRDAAAHTYSAWTKYPWPTDWKNEPTRNTTFHEFVTGWNGYRGGTGYSIEGARFVEYESSEVRGRRRSAGT